VDAAAVVGAAGLPVDGWWRPAAVVEAASAGAAGSDEAARRPAVAAGDLPDQGAAAPGSAGAA
jgi:hypothetical protein